MFYPAGPQERVAFVFGVGGQFGPTAFYLAGAQEPTNDQEFIRALEGGIREVVALPTRTGFVQLSGQYPRLDTLRIDLTGGRLDPTRRIPRPEGMGRTKPAIAAKVFEMIAHPLWVQAAGMKLDMTARDVAFLYDSDPAGRLLLLPSACADGQLTLEISQPDMEALLLSQAKAAAAEHGVTVTKARVNLVLHGERSLAIDARVTVKKALFSGVIRFIAQLDLDEQLNARISQLDVRGEGMAGTLAAGALRPKVTRFEGFTTPLAGLAFAGLRPRGVRIVGVDPIRIVLLFQSGGA